MRGRKIQLVCPKCKYEFRYNNGYYDENITRLGLEIHDIHVQLQEHALKTREEQRANTAWWKSAKKALTEKQKEIFELKAFRKLADEQREKQEFQAFKNAVKDICGEEAYKKCLGIMLEEVEAYRVSDMAKVPYTSNKAPVTGINKL